MFIIDFDNTLFDTTAFRIELIKIFAEFGVTKEDFIYSADLAIHGATGTHYDYTVEGQIQILQKKGYQIPTAIVLKKVKELLKTSFVYPDTISFLESLKEKTQKLILLTAGNTDFQMSKIYSVGIEDYFDEIVCVHNKKEEYVESVYTPHEKIFFINDKLKENLDVRNKREDIVVVTKRNPEKNTKEELKESGIPHFETLIEILNYIETYGQE